MQKPSIGRIVHYTNLGDKDGKFPPEIQAATITGVYKRGDGTHPASIRDNEGYIEPANKVGDKAEVMAVDITVWYRTGYFQMKACPFSEAPERGHWNWPPRD